MSAVLSEMSVANMQPPKKCPRAGGPRRLFQSNQNRIIVSCAVEMAVLPSPSIGVRCLRLALSLPADAGEMLWSVWAVTSRMSRALFTIRPFSLTTPQNIPCIGQRQLPASVARSHAVLALARGYSFTDRIAPGDTARLRVGVLTGH